MSSRQLRKLQKQRELEEKVVREAEASEVDDDDEEEEEEDIGAKTRRPQLNLFAALGGGDDDNDDGGADDDDDKNDDALGDKGEQGAPQELDEASQRVEPAAQQRKKGNKKKKGKKGKKGKAAAVASENARSSDDGEEDEIDKAIQELGLTSKRDDAAAPAGSPEARRAGPEVNELLRVNTQHLKVIHEMRNLFGRDVIESADAEEQLEGASQRRGRQRVQHVDLETFLREPAWAKKLPEISLRRNVFIQGREHWPRATAGGLTMVVVGTAADGVGTEYAYAYDQNYDNTQTLFFALVQMGDPMQMVGQLKATPYHVSMLLQVSSVAKQDQNMALAAELCERALFTFGRMTTSAFRRDIEQGRARLDFNRPENRQFWLAGYHYIKSLVRKGTYRTALEWAKLLFAMDPRDPYAMRHFIHVLAIRAHEATWLLGFLDKLGEMSGAGDAIYLQQTRVLALLQKGDAEGARACLARGMQQVPWLYCALFQELNMDAPPSVWGISAESGSDSRAFWVKLYLHQAKDIWNNTQATALLLDVAKGLERVDVAGLPADDPPVDRGSVRLAFLDGQTGLMGLAPRKILESEPNYEFDPLPPPEDDNIFSTPGTMVAWADTPPGDDQQPRPLHLIREDIERHIAEHEQMELEFQRNGGPEAYGEWAPVLRRAARLAAEAARDAGIAATLAGINDGGMMDGLLRMLGVRLRGEDGEPSEPREPEEHGEPGEPGEPEGAEGGAEGQESRRALLPGAWPEMEAGVYDYDEEDEAYDLANNENEER